MGTRLCSLVGDRLLSEDANGALRFSRQDLAPSTEHLCPGEAFVVTTELSIAPCSRGNDIVS